LIAKRKICFDGSEGALKSIAMGVCYYLAETIKPSGDGVRQASTPMETAIISVIRQMLLEGFAKHPPKPGTPVELVSSTVA
jgi:hypothetical protein